MIFKREINICIGIIFIFLLNSCQNLKNIEIGEVHDIQLKGFKNNVLLAEAKIPVENPSNFKIKVNEINLKVSVNDRYLGRLISDKEIIIPANSDDEYIFPFMIRISNIIFGVTLMFELPNMKNIKIGTKGYVKGKTLLLNKKVEIEEEIMIESFK